MDRFPDSLIAFQRMFPHGDACVGQWLASPVRWPEGFEWPRCGHGHGWDATWQGRRHVSSARAAIARPCGGSSADHAVTAASSRSPSGSGPPSQMATHSRRSYRPATLKLQNQRWDRVLSRRLYRTRFDLVHNRLPHAAMILSDIDGVTQA